MCLESRYKIEHELEFWAGEDAGGKNPTLDAGGWELL